MKEPTMEEQVGVFQAQLCRASGEVSDKRRLVAFLYLLARDHTPLGEIGNVLHELSTTIYDPAAPTPWDQSVMDRAARVSDAPNERLRDFMRRCRPLLTDEVYASIEVNLPLRDDVDTVFTNGWLARYAQWAANELARP